MIGVSQKNFANYVVDKSSNSPKIKRALSTSMVVHICDLALEGEAKDLCELEASQDCALQD